jgi:DegV family protein with EDD domain
MSVKISTDSGADLSPSVIEQYGITVLPFGVSDATEQYLDGQTLMPKQLLDNMRQGTVYKTSQVSIEIFQQCFIECAEQFSEVIYISFSSALSGTYQTALLVKQMIEDEHVSLDMEIIDTKCASLGVGLIVYHAAQLAQAGKSKDEIVNVVRDLSNHMEQTFTVDNLDYLYRGGRVSKTSAVIGGLLNIKPVLEVQDGKLVPIEKIRGRAKVIQRMVELMGVKGASNLQEQVIGITHGDDLAAVEILQSLITEKYGCQKFMINSIGAAIGAHSGPGTLALFFLNKEI